METICKQCQCTFKTKPSRVNRFCSRNCYTLFQKGNKKLWGVNDPNFNKIKLLEIRKKHSEFLKGKPSWNKGLRGKGICKSNSGSFKKGKHLDEKHPRWKGGHIIYWRKKALKRDNYTCCICNLREPKIMEVAHLIPVNGNKNRMISGNNLNKLDNLVTMCPNDHKRYDKGLLRGDYYTGQLKPR